MTVLLTLSLGAVALSGCENQQAETKDEAEGEAEGEHAVVESGTYTGTIQEVNADESEIYVDADGKELELYFIEETELTQNGEAAEFSALEKGQKVEVEIKKVGKRLDPLSVKILE
jgi:hypothetical protein